MTILDYRNKIKDLINDLPNEAQRLCTVQAQSGLTIVKNRSINNGIFYDSEEGNTVDYSKNPVNTKKFKGKERNRAGLEFIKSHRFATWHDFRVAQGLTSEKVNASYTNRFWTSLGILRVQFLDNGTVVVIGNTDESLDYIPFLADRYGNFINPTPNEIESLQADTTVDLLNFIKLRI